MNDTLLSVILAIVAASPGIAALLANRLKAQAEANAINVASLKEMIAEGREDNKQLRDEIAELKKEFSIHQEDLEAAQAENTVLVRKVLGLERTILDLRAKIEQPS